MSTSSLNTVLIGTLFLTLVSVQSTLGQSDNATNLRIGLMAESLSHPGVSIGLTSVLSTSVKSVERKRKSFDINKELLLIPQIGVYQHFSNHTGIIYGIAIGKKRQREGRNLTHMFGLGVGGLTQINAGITYETDENGDIKESSLSSRTYFHPQLFYEVGYRLSKTLQGYTRLQLGVKTPYNTYFSIVPVIESGIAFSLKQNNE